jgi:hypothetical protein
LQQFRRANLDRYRQIQPAGWCSLQIVRRQNVAYIAITRAGVASVVQAGGDANPLWIGSEVLSEAEIAHLRASGIELAVFVHPVRTSADIEDAVSTLREHHPNQAVWVEAIPSSFNPRSADFGQAFLWREYIAGVDYQHNEYVLVTTGPSAGTRGSLVALLALSPEPEFILESEFGADIHVHQSALVRADA